MWQYRKYGTSVKTAATTTTTLLAFAGACTRVIFHTLLEHVTRRASGGAGAHSAMRAFYARMYDVCVCVSSVRRNAHDVRTRAFRHSLLFVFVVRASLTLLKTRAGSWFKGMRFYAIYTLMHIP